MGCTEEGRDPQANAGGDGEADARENGSGSFEAPLSRKSHPVVCLGCGLGVLPVIYIL